MGEGFGFFGVTVPEMFPLDSLTRLVYYSGVFNLPDHAQRRRHERLSGAPLQPLHNVGRPQDGDLERPYSDGSQRAGGCYQERAVSDSVSHAKGP